ncbi:MAG TPA: NADP-dependent oxidoreductase, partial [Solirubrobacteraceae bacterium]|nr:NADP-dependent oxidoreductase [Solirubrobacteraceae bacterium]
RVPVGQQVMHMLGWREYALVPAEGARPIDTALAPAAAYLGVLGVTGFTAYVGLFEIAKLREGDVVFVSAAAGAVGSIAGQLAKIKGCRVIGSAGSVEKVDYLVNVLGFDAAFNYRDGPVRDSLRRAAPDGIDVYFDNVGGEHLEAALESLRDFGRVAMCGAISLYNATELPPGPRNIPEVVRKRLMLRGFIITDHMQLMGDFVRDVGGWLQAGKIDYRETVVEGIERAPEALIGLFRGQNLGKMLVHIGDG